MKILLGLFGFATLAAAQMSFIGAGASISVRTNEALNVRKADGRVFLGVVERDDRLRQGNDIIRVHQEDI